MALSRARVLNTVRVGLLLLILAAVGWSLWDNWGRVSVELGRVSPGTIALAFGIGLVSPVFTMLGWRVLLADLGSRLHVAQAAGVFFVGQLGKYLPGSVWTVIAQAEMGARLDVPRRRSAVVGLVMIGISVLTGALVGIPALPLLLDRRGGSVSWWLVGLAVVVGLVVLSPAALNWAIGLGLRVLRREPLEHALSLPAVALSVTWFIAAWVTMGTSVWVLARAVAPAGHDATQLAVVAISGFVLAATIGMVSFLLPAGLGIRDGLLILLLGAVMSVPAATAVVVLARFSTVVGDIVVAGGGWIWARTHDLLPGQHVDL